MSFPRYPAYRDSGVAWLGEVPAHWTVKRLRYVARFNPSRTEIEGLDRDTQVSFLPMEAIGDDGTLVLDRTRPIAEVETGYTYFRDGDVVVAKITPCFENGKGAVIQGLEGGIGFGTTELIVARPKPGVSAAFLDLLFRADAFRQLGVSHMYGAGGQKRVPESFVRDFSAAFPPRIEQEEIAAAVAAESAAIDDLQLEQQRLIALLKEKRQAVISQAVTKGLDPHAPMKDSGVEWLGEVPAHWHVLPLKRVWSVTDCKHITADFLDDGYPIASIREVQGRFVDLTDAKRTSREFYELLTEGGRLPQPGDLIFSRNATVGQVAQVSVLHPPFAVGQDVCLLRPRTLESSSDFLQLALQSPAVVQQVALAMIGSTFKRINVEEIRNFVIAFPPPREQAAIAGHLIQEGERVDALIAEAEHAIALLQERRAALISAAVTGKIDVRRMTEAAA